MTANNGKGRGRAGSILASDTKGDERRFVLGIIILAAGQQLRGKGFGGVQSDKAGRL